MVNYVRAYWYLHCLKKHVFWTSDRLRKYQNKMLKRIVKYAYDNVPFFHEKFDELKIKPDDVRTVEDLEKLPIIRKDDIRGNLDKLISREYDVSSLKMLKTSGSTGEPLCFYISGAEDEFRKAKHLRANIALGQRLRDRWVTITAPVHFNETTRLQRILGIYAPLSVSVFDDVATQFSCVEKLKPDVLDGYASSLLLLAKETGRRGSHTIAPRFMISGAEVIDVSSRRFIEDMFGAPLFDQYATAEFERLAWQCEEKGEYHIDADSVILEFVDENGEGVGSGESGEIICTSLFNYAMPFIRYALGDLGRSSQEKDCSCGRTFPLMKVVEGRANDVIVLPDGRVMSAVTFLAGIYQLSFYKDIYKFRIIQKEVDRFKFLVKLRDCCCLDRGVAEKELREFFSRLFNVDGEVDFELEFVDDIPLDKSGKFRVIISEVADRSLRGM
jgi:phenylacetate-CoA ligase